MSVPFTQPPLWHTAPCIVLIKLHCNCLNYYKIAGLFLYLQHICKALKESETNGNPYLTPLLSTMGFFFFLIKARITALKY